MIISRKFKDYCIDLKTVWSYTKNRNSIGMKKKRGI